MNEIQLTKLVKNMAGVPVCQESGARSVDNNKGVPVVLTKLVNIRIAILRRYIASDLKDLNRRTVYNLLIAAGEISRAEISRRTGISSPTVIKIINHFRELGFVSFEGEGESRLGRKPQIIRLNRLAACSVGVDFQGDQVRIGVVDLLGRVLAQKNFAIRPDFVAIMKQRLAGMIEEVILRSGVGKDRIIGVGIGVPGAVSADRRVVELAPLMGIRGPLTVERLIVELEARLGLPVLLEKDVNAAVLGEFVHRTDLESTDLVYISVGTGIGAGLILDGKLRRGRNNLAGEIGYLFFEKGVAVDTSTPGWLESRIGYTTFAGSPDPHSAVDRVAEDLALGIANLSILIDVDRVVIGGIGAELLGPPLLAALNARLASLSLRPVRCLAPVCPEPGVVGAAWIATDARLAELLDGTKPQAV